MTCVFFSRSKGPERQLSNFFPCDVPHENVLFPSIENAFQAAKYLRSTRPEVFVELASMTPAEARSAGSKTGMRRRGAALDVAAWDRDSVGVMERLVAIRVVQDPGYRSAIAAARKEGTALLHFERSGKKSFWGGSFPAGCERVPANFVGRNMLGKILMKCDV